MTDQIHQPPDPGRSPAAAEGQRTIEEFYTLTGVSPLDMSQKQKSNIRAYFDSSSFAFNWYIFQHQDLVPEIHGEICSILDVWGYCEMADGSWRRDPGSDLVVNDYRRVMIQIPREFYKTSTCTKANALHQVTRFPDEAVAIFNERLENAKKWMKAIREIIENNKLFQEVYRDLLPPGVHWSDKRSMPRSWAWSDEKMQLQRGVMGIPESSLTALGIGAATAGGHWPTIIKDDLISEDAVKSPTVMEGVKQWFDNSLYLERPALKGRDLIACTCWAPDDLYQYVLKNYNYKLYRRSALESDDGKPDLSGDSIFPAKLTREDLLKHYRRNPSGFLTQMMNLPLAGGVNTFPDKWVRTFEVIERYGRPVVRIFDSYYDPKLSEAGPAPQEVPIEHMELRVLLDPATARKSLPQTKDYAKNGLVAVGRCPWGRRFFFESASFRTTNKGTIEQTLDMAIRWGIPIIGIEDVTFSEVYRDWMQDLLLTDRRYRPYDNAIGIMGLETGGTAKAHRVQRMQTPYQAGLYYFNATGTEELREELAAHPNGMTVDVVDAASYAEKYLPRPPTPTEVEDRWWRRQAQEQDLGRDPVTGY